MKIVILVAMQKELNLLLQEMPGHVSEKIDGFEVFKGKIGNHDILLTQCGIGKVNSALRTCRIIESYQPDLIINSGVAGGVDASMKIGAMLVADRVAYHDVWCGPGTEYGEADGCPLFFTPSPRGLEIFHEIAESAGVPLRFGLLCSGDKFISDAAEVKEIKSHFPEALGCDMESASIAQTCFKYNVPFLIFRVMSDMPGGEEHLSQYTNFWNDVPKRSFNALTIFLEKL